MYMRTLFQSSFAALLIALLFFTTSVPSLEAATRSSRSSFKETVSASELRAAYAEAAAGGEKVRILVMPGHEPQYGGAEFIGYYEREFVVTIANLLEKELGTDANFEIVIPRGNQGWDDGIDSYFDRQERKIKRFIEDHKEEYEKLLDRGRVEEQAAHNAAPGDVATRLYGITKWANENDVDLMVHLHLNDEMSHAAGQRGTYSGAAIYVPDSIYGNADASKEVAEPVLERLNATTPTSNFGYETKGIVEDRELIAIGAFNTSEVPSILIEYGYIYEPRITGDGARDAVFADFAYQTALGIKEFFGAPVSARYDTKALPHTFASDILATSTASTTSATDIYALQALLRELNFYPGSEASLGVCPVSGITNECMAAAVKAFQASKGLEQTGTLGPQTRAALNAAQGLSTPVLSAVPAPAAPAPAPTTPAPAAACAAFASTLALDATDATTNGEVSRLQAILAKDKAVYPEGLVTGFYGPATDKAVKRFQVANTIVVSTSSAYGLVGPATKTALLVKCAE